MKITLRHHLDAIAILELKGVLTRTNTFVQLRGYCRDLVANGCRAVLIDLTDCRDANMSGLAALIALAGEDFQLHLAFCGVRARVMRKLQACGLDRGLHIHANLAEALASDPVQRAGLCKTPAVILCNEDRQNASPLTQTAPLVMLDIFGKPMIAHAFAHLIRYGIHRVIANPGHLGAQIVNYFHSAGQNEAVLTFAQEFAQEGAGAGGNPAIGLLKTASSLKQIQDTQSAFDRDFLVVNGNQLTDVDLAALKAQHAASGAEVTVALNSAVRMANRDVPQPVSAEEKITRQSLGVFAPHAVAAMMISPKVLNLVPKKQNWGIGDDLLPAMIDQGRQVNIFRSTCFSQSISTPNDYAGLLTRALKGTVPLLDPEITPCDASHLHHSRHGYREGTGAGRSFVSPTAKVDASAELVGNCVIGAGARVRGPSVLEDCIVMPSTEIVAGFWAQNMILHTDWSIDHGLSNSLSTCAAYTQDMPVQGGVAALPRKSA